MGFIKNFFEKRSSQKEAMEKRLAEPPLTDEERQLFYRFKRVKDASPWEFKRKFGELPEYEDYMNRIEIRALLQNPDFLPTVINAEQKKEQDKQRAIADAQKEQAYKLKRIDEFYADELNPIRVSLGPIYDTLDPKSKGNIHGYFYEQLTGQKIGADNKATSAGGILFEAVLDKGAVSLSAKKFNDGLAGSTFTRTLRDFPEGHRALLRLADILTALGMLNERELYSTRLSFIWNEGKTQLDVPSNLSAPNDKSAFKNSVQRLIETRFGSPESAAELVQGKCRTVMDRRGDSNEKTVLGRYLYSGTRWLNSSDTKTLVPNVTTDRALRLGAFPDGQELLYDRAESLVTVAPPGSGKSTSHVLRNLLYLNGPAVVLDVKGDMFAATAGWRRANVGPVYKFAPADRETSLHFNPLDFISTDPDDAYEESERLAELLTVPAEEGEYFDERAIQVIRAMVLYVALTREGAARSMETVLDLLAGGEEHDPLADSVETAFDALITRMSMSDIPSLRRMGKALQKMPDRQREGVFDTARTKLKVWESPAIARLTRESTFRPQMLREQRATLYLCVELADIKRYASVLRVLLGSCIGSLCKGTPAPDAEVVTFFLDELPRLRRMDVVEEALDVGRGFGVRLWMFAQNIGQLKSAYPNADGMVGNCFAQCYMNPDPERSKWLQNHLGIRRGLLDGSERPLVEASELTGREYADKVVVMLTGMDNAVLTKRPYYQDRVAMERVTLAEPLVVASATGA